MTSEEARKLFLENCRPGDRGALELYGEAAAVDAIMAVTEHLEDEVRRLAEHYQPHSDGRNTFVMFADKIADLTAERLTA